MTHHWRETNYRGHMYNGVLPTTVGMGVIGGSLAATGSDTLMWVAVAAALLMVGLVLLRLSSVARTAGRHRSK